MSSILARKAFLKQIGTIFLTGIMVLISRLFGGFLLRFLKTERFVEIDRKRFMDAPFATENFFAEKSAAGVRVLSRKCPHLGCTLQKEKARGKIICPCHGSTFTTEGKYISGPAHKDMRRLSFRRSAPDRIQIKL